MPQQANSYGWIPLARAAAVKGSLADVLIGGQTVAVAALVSVVVVVEYAVRENTKLLSMYCCLLACEL